MRFAPRPPRSLLVLAGLLHALGAAPLAMAASSTSSAVSDSIGTSVGSLSKSLETSSGSSTHNNKDDVAQGDYRIVEMATVPERPGTVRLKMQAVATPGPAGELRLYVPAATAEQERLSTGQVVTARHRPYGVEFADAHSRQAFFLALDDTWYRELQTRAVGSAAL